MTLPLRFDHRPSLASPVPRSVYTARDTADRLYTIGINADGTDGFAAVYDPATAATVHARTYFGLQMRLADLQHHLQAVADGLDTHQENQ